MPLLCKCTDCPLENVPSVRSFHLSLRPLFKLVLSNDGYWNLLQCVERPVGESHQSSRGLAVAESGSLASFVTACPSARQPILHNPRLLLPRTPAGDFKSRFLAARWQAVLLSWEFFFPFNRVARRVEGQRKHRESWLAASLSLTDGCPGWKRALQIYRRHFPSHWPAKPPAPSASDKPVLLAFQVTTLLSNATESSAAAKLDLCLISRPHFRAHI